MTLGHYVFRLTKGFPTEGAPTEGLPKMKLSKIRHIMKNRGKTVVPSKSLVLIV